MGAHRSTPGLDEVASLAARALALLADDGQVEVLWERRLRAGEPTDRLTATVTVRVDGRGGRVMTEDVDDDHLRRAARQASLRARQARAWPAPPLPAPAEAAPASAPAVDGLDVVGAALELEAAAGPGVAVALEAGLARRAVASTAGIRAAEERSHVVARVAGRRPDGWEASAVVGGVVGPADVADAAAGVRALLGEREPAGPFAVHVDAGLALLGQTALGPEPVVVLGPAAVATVLEQLRAAAGVDAAMGAGPFGAQRGGRVASPGITLVDDATSPATLGRRFDAEGVPRQRVVLLEDGVVAGQVHDQPRRLAAGAGAHRPRHAGADARAVPGPPRAGAGRGAAVSRICSNRSATGSCCRALPPAFEPGDDGTPPRRHRRDRSSGTGTRRGRLAPVEVEVSALERARRRRGADAARGGSCRCAGTRRAGSGRPPSRRCGRGAACGWSRERPAGDDGRDRARRRALDPHGHAEGRAGLARRAARRARRDDARAALGGGPL